MGQVCNDVFVCELHVVVSCYFRIVAFYTNSKANITDIVSEWLRRWTRNPLGSARGGSNPLGVGFAVCL